MSEGLEERRGADPPSEARPVNGYLLHEEIGSGGMSRVYRATREGTDDEVAVKVMRIENMDPDFERRLRREPEVQKGLGHENIVRLIDWFRVRDEFFLVMEYVNGRSLGQIIYRESGPMPFERARVYTRQALRALNHLHSLGIIHRDIKPSNILVGRDDAVKLADFGIAKFAWQQGQTKTQKGLGTPEYMSPEQARGTQIDHRTDIYSLGITLFEMLTARKPFARGEETPMAYVEVIQSILTRPLPDPRTFQPGIPVGAVRLLSRATAKEPLERFQSASEFLGALEMVEENEFSPATVAIGDIPGTGAAAGVGIEPTADDQIGAARRRFEPEPEPERESGRGVLWAVLLLLLVGAGGFFGYRYYQANYANQPVRALTAVEAMEVSKRMTADYMTFSRDHNPGGLASLFSEEGNHYFSLENASREDIERDAERFFRNMEVTNQYEIQVRRARAVNDSTIDGEWIFTYERIKKDGAVLRGQTSDRIRMQLIDGDWYLTRQTTNWAKRRNEPPPTEVEPQVIDVPQPDTTVQDQPRDQGGGGSNPPLFPPPTDTLRRERSGGRELNPDRNRDPIGSPRSGGAGTRSRAPTNRSPEWIGPPERSGEAR